jgi:MoxR-like ATPase
MFNVMVSYPSEVEEFDIVRLTTAPRVIDLKHVLSAGDVMGLQELVRKVPVADHVVKYAIRLVRQTRVGQADTPKFIKDDVSWGAGPRASQTLVLAGKARALLQGRYHVSTEDIRAVAYPTLRHRVLTNFNAEAEGIRPDDIIKMLIENTPRDAEDERTAAQLPKVFAAQK